MKHKVNTKNHSLSHSSAIVQKSKILRELHKLVVGMCDLMLDHVQEEAKQAKTLSKTIKAKHATIATLAKISNINKKQIIDWKIKCIALKDDLASTYVDALYEEIENWK